MNAYPERFIYIVPTAVLLDFLLLPDSGLIRPAESVDGSAAISFTEALTTMLTAVAEAMLIPVVGVGMISIGAIYIFYTAPSESTPEDPHEEHPIDRIKRRFAEGEITYTEFENRLDSLLNEDEIVAESLLIEDINTESETDVQNPAQSSDTVAASYLNDEGQDGGQQ